MEGVNIQNANALTSLLALQFFCCSSTKSGESEEKVFRNDFYLAYI